MEQVTKLLEQLAIKLGTTVEYLWGVLIKQQIADAYVRFVVSAILLSIIAISIFIVPKAIKKLDDKKPYYDVFLDRQDGWIIYMSVFMVITTIALFAIASAIKILYNPEYYALREILDLLK